MRKSVSLFELVVYLPSQSQGVIPGRWIVEPVCNTLSKGRTQVQSFRKKSCHREDPEEKTEKGKSPKQKRSKNNHFAKTGQRSQVHAKKKKTSNY